MNDLTQCNLGTIKPRHVTYADWANAESLSDAVKPGDYVEEYIIDDFCDMLPPVTLTAACLQIGEPDNHMYDPETDKWRGTFATFSKDIIGWKFCGYCFIGKNTPPENFAEAVQGA